MYITSQEHLIISLNKLLNKNTIVLAEINIPAELVLISKTASKLLTDFWAMLKKTVKCRILKYSAIRFATSS